VKLDFNSPSTSSSSFLAHQQSCGFTVTTTAIFTTSAANANAKNDED
jgi:hypothetical protein